MASKILITGSIAFDLLLHCETSFADALQGSALEELSVSFVAPHFERHHGGTGANIAWTLKLLGDEPLIVGTVGEDGGSYLALLKERGIDVEHVAQLSGKVTATAIVSTDDHERQIAFYHPGADAAGSWPDLAGEREDIAWAVISARDIRLMVEAIAWCEAQKLPFLFDPGQQVMSFSDAELKRAVKSASGIVVNAFEISLLSERLRQSEEDIAKTVPFLIITHGEKGFALFWERGAQTKFFPACRAEQVVNPTGAGDAFRSGLLHGIVSGWELPQAAMLGASVASFVVEQRGTLLNRLDLDAVQERAQVAYGKLLRWPARSERSDRSGG